MIDSSQGRGARFPNSSLMVLKKQMSLYMKRDALTAAALARASGVSKQVISLWLAGANPKHINQVKKVATVFGVTVDELCFGEANKPEPLRAEDPFGNQDWISGKFEVRFRRIKE